MTFPRIRKSNLVYLALLLILVAYVVSVIRLHPTNFFGLFEDDSIYFSSAKALAQGQGYVLPSVPGTPPATKYPILYPLILSLVWRWNPSFPANLAGAVAVTVAFGIAYVIAGFFFLRNLKIFGNVEIIVLTAFCALHPLVLFFSGNVLSDIPFAALTMVGMVFADKFLEPGASSGSAVTCAVLTGLSVLMRIFGVATVTGILVASFIRRAWKQLLIFAVFVSPFFIIIVWRNIFSPAINTPAAGISASSTGWLRAWAYYTNYIAIWKFGVPNAHIFWSMVRNNLELVIQAPADLFLSPLMVSDTISGRALVLLVSALTFAGIARLSRISGWRAFHYIVPFFVMIILCWNYSDAGNRFLLPFYFIFVAGFGIEIGHVARLLRKSLFGKSTKMPEKIVAMALGAGILTLGAGVAFNYAYGRRLDVYSLSQQRGKLLTEKREAYRWLAEEQMYRGPILAVEDANVYLYSGRSAFSPVIFPTSSLYEKSYVDDSLDQLMDVANALNADLWLFAEDDFSMESKGVAAAVRGRLGQTGPSDWPIVFSSSGGRVVIRSLHTKPNLKDSVGLVFKQE